MTDDFKDFDDTKGRTNGRRQGRRQGRGEGESRSQGGDAKTGSQIPQRRSRLPQRCRVRKAETDLRRRNRF